MPRFIGKRNAISNQLDVNINTALDRTSWTKTDFYTKMMDTASNSGKYKRYCLDFTDAEMTNNQPLKRFHQVTICGNDQALSSKADPKGDLIGGFVNDRTYIITAQLPPSFRYSIGGNWSTPLKSVLDYSKFNGLASSFTSGQNSGLFGLATMSVWESPNPLQVQLTLSCFDDIGSDTNQNTLEAIDIFSRWSLPYMVTQYGMYAGLPGPAVPPINIKYNKYTEGTKTVKESVENSDTQQSTVVERQVKTVEKAEGQDTASLIIASKEQNRLSVMIGGMLFLDHCILKTVDVNYINTKAQYLHDYHTATFSNGTDAGIRLLPIRCDITLTFETIMGLTQTNFRQMLALRENSDPSTMNDINIGVIQDSLGEDIGSEMSKDINSLKAMSNNVSKVFNSGG